MGKSYLYLLNSLSKFAILVICGLLQFNAASAEIVQGRNATFQMKADGTKIIQDADGSLVEIRPDGTKTITKADGTQVQIRPDGTKLIKPGKYNNS